MEFIGGVEIVKLTERNKYGTAQCRDIPQANIITIIDKLAAYEEAEENLELVISAMNNSQTIYVIHNCYEPGGLINAIITDYTCHIKETVFAWTGLEIYQAFKGYFTVNEIGKTIFFTEEEAEAHQSTERSNKL